MSSSIPVPKKVKFTSDGAAKRIVSDTFRPSKVEVFNSTQLAKYEAIDGMTDAHAMKQVTDGTLSEITTNGITIDDSGATLGTGVQNASDVLYAVLFP